MRVNKGADLAPILTWLERDGLPGPELRLGLLGLRLWRGSEIHPNL